MRGPQFARPGGWLARYPAAGMALVFLGAILFGAITLGWQSSPALIATDKQLSQALHDHALSQPRPLVSLIGDTSFFIGKDAIVLIAPALILIFILRKRWREAWMLILGSGGAGAGWFLMSRYFDRDRPAFPVDLDPITDPGYPSGHSASALIFYTLMAYLIAPHLKSRFLRGVVYSLAVLIWAFVGFGRLYVGGHYPTDVLAGYAFGLAWGALVFTAVERVYARRSPRQAEAIVEDSTSPANG